MSTQTSTKYTPHHSHIKHSVSTHQLLEMNKLVTLLTLKWHASPGTNTQMGTAGLNGEKEMCSLQQDGLQLGPASDCLQQLQLLGMEQATGESLLWETCSLR